MKISKLLISVSLLFSISQANENLVNFSKNNDLNGVKSTLESGIDSNSAFNGASALMWSSKNGNKEIVDLLISKGSNVNLQDGVGFTPLLYSIIEHKTDIAKLLVSKGSNVNLVNNKGNTPLMLSIETENIDLIKFLLKNGADKNIKNKEGSTALDTANDIENKEIIDLLK